MKEVTMNSYSRTTALMALLSFSLSTPASVPAQPNQHSTPRENQTDTAFDSKTHQWAIWWLDSRDPLGPLAPL